MVFSAVSSKPSLVKQSELDRGARAIKPDGTIDPRRFERCFNPPDLAALEAALDLKDRMGGLVFALSMGPPDAEAVLKDCYRCGTDAPTAHRPAPRRLGHAGTSYALAKRSSTSRASGGRWTSSTRDEGARRRDGAGGPAGRPVARAGRASPHGGRHRPGPRPPEAIPRNIIITARRGGAFDAPCVTIDAPTKYTIRTPLASRLLNMKAFQMEKLDIDMIGLDVPFIGGRRTLRRRCGSRSRRLGLGLPQDGLHHGRPKIPQCRKVGKLGLLKLGA